MAGLGTGAPIVKVYHEKSIILPDVSRVLACLYEKEIDFTRETFSSYKSLLRLQASGHVPVPFYDGPNKFLEESREICRHIAETYEDHGYPFLLGKDSLERASIEEWLHHEEHNFNPPSRSLFCHLAFPVAEEDDDIDLQTRKLEDVLEVYEQRLGDSEFLAGNKFTLADLVHLPNSYHITNSEKFLYLYDSRKNVQRWWHDISSRGSWQKVLKVMHEVERQNKQEELDKQQQRKQEELEKQQRRQWRRQHPPTSRSPFRLDSREQPSTKPHTILVRPPASIIAPKAPQAEEPHPTETSRDETPVSSSISIPTTHKAPDIRSKHTIISTTHEERPPASLQSTPRIPEKSPIPVERRINFFTPATSPITEKPSRNGADKSRIRDAPLPSEATEIDLPTKSKPSSSKKASDNLHDFYEASRHTDEAEPYTGSISQKPSEMLDEISETDGPSNAIDHAETSPRSAKEDSDRLRTSGFWTENTAPTADTQDKKSVRYTERTSQRPVGNISSRATDQRVTYTSPEKPHSTEAHQKLQSEQWHAAVAGFPADRRKDASLPKGARDDTQAIPLYDDDTNQEARETASAPRQTRAQDPYDTSEGTSSRSQPISAPHDAVPPPKQATSEGPYARKDVVEARRFHVDRRKDAPLPKRVRDDTQANPLYDDDDDTNQEARETASAPRRARAQDPYYTPEGTSSRSQPVNAPHDAVPPPKRATSEGPYARKDVVEARRFPADRRKDAPLPKRVQDDTQAIPLYDDDDTGQEARETASAPRRTRAQDPYDTSEGIGTYHSSSSRPHPVNAPHDAVPPPKQAASEGSRRATTPYLAAQEVFQQGKKSPASRLIVPHDAQGSTEEETVESSSKAHPLDSHLADVRPPNQFLDEDGYGAITPLQTGDTDDPYNEKRDRGVAAPKRMMSQDAFEETKMTDSAAFEAQTSDHWQADAPPQKQRPTEDPETTASPSKKRYTDDEDTAKQAKHAHQKLQSEQWHAATTGLSKLKGEADDLMPPTQQAKPSKDVQHISPQDAEQANTWPLAQEPAGMDGQLVQGPERTARTPHTDKRRDVSSMLWRQAADVQGIAEDRASSDQGGAVRPPYAPKDTAEARIVPAALRKDASFPKHAQDKTQAAPLYDDDHDTNQEARETASAPRRTTTPQDAVHPPKQAVFEGPRRATTPYPAAQEITQARRSPASRSTVPHDAQGSTEEETLEETKFVESASSRAQPVEDTSEEAETRNSALFRRPSPDAWPAAAPPSKEAAAEDALRVSQSSPARYPRAEETSKQPRAPVSIPTHIAAQDARDVFREPKVADSTPLQKRYPDAKDVAKKSTVTFEETKISDSAPPRGQPLDSQRADAPSWKKEAADAPSRGQPLYSQRADAPSWKKEATEDPRATSAFDKTRPYVEDSTRQAADTDFGPRQIGDEHTEEKKVADSAPSVRERHTYTPRTARPLSQLAEEEEDAQDKYREGRETARPLSQQAEEEEDVQDKDREGMETVSAPKKMVSRDAHDTYGERRTPHSTSTSPTPSKAQPADSRSPIKVERPRSVYEEDHLVGQDSHKQPQTLPTGGRADGSTLKHQQDPVVPSISEEKSSTPPAPPRARVRDDHPTEDPFKGDIVGDRKGAPPQLGQEPISQVQRATELSQEAAPDGELSTIDQWRRTSVPLQGDDVLGGSTIDQKPTPMSEQSIPSARRANEMVKKEQRMVPPARTGAQTPDVQRAPSSFSRADTAERDREPVQMQAPTQHARPTSVPTRRATPDARDTSDQEFANKSDAQRWNALKAKHDLAMTSEDDRNASPSTHDAAVDNKTALPASEAQGSDTWPGSTATPVNAQPTSGDARVGRFSRAQGAQPPESTQAQPPFDAPRDSVSTPDVPRDTLDKTKSAKPTSTEGMTPTAAAPTSKVQLAEQKFAPSDKKLGRAARPTSTEGMTPTAGPAPTSKAQLPEQKFAPSDNKPEKPQTIFRQEASPSAPITKQVPSSDAHHDTRKIQQATLDNVPTDDSSIPPFPSHEQVSHAPQAFPSKKDRAPAPGTKDSPASNTQIASAKVQETMPDNYGIDELTVPSVSSEKQGSYAGSSTEPHEGSFPDAYGATDDKDITKYPSRQAPVLEYRPDSTPADSYVRPISGSEVFPAVKKSAPSDKDSIQSAQQPSPAETRKEETIFAAAEPTLPTTVSKDTQVSRRPIKAERTPSAYQEDHLVAQDSHEQPQTLPTGGRADDSTPKRQQDPKEKSSTPPAPPRARVRDDHPTEEPFNGDTVDEQKGAPPLLGQEPTSQVQRATELSQEEAAPDGDMSSKPSTIGQWQRTSVPLQAITPNSGDDVLGRSTIDQKPTPMSEQSIPSARGASEMVEKEQRMAPPARPGARTPDVLNAPSSFSAADRAERDGEPVQMQAPTLHDQGAQPPESTQAQSPFDAPRDSVSTQDVPSDALDKTNVAKPTSTEGKAPTPTSKAQLAEEKFAPSDKKLARAARPTSTESMPHTAGPAPSLKAQLSEQNFAPSDKKPEKPQTIFRQEARPSAPITKQVPSSDAHHDTRKIQQVTLDNVPTDDSSIPPFPSHEQVSHAPQAFPSKKDRAPAPGTKDSPASNTQIASAKVQETMPDNYRTDELTVPSVSSERQGSYAGSSTEPHEGSSPDAYGAADAKDITKYPSRQAPVLEYMPDSTPVDSYVRPISGSEVFPAVKKSAPSDQDSIQSAKQPSPAETKKEETIVAAAEPTLPTIVGKDTEGMRGTPTFDYEPTGDKRADIQSGRSDEVALPEQKSGPSDRDSARSTQSRSSAEPMDEELNYPSSAKPLSSATPDQTKDSQPTIGQQAPAPGTSEYPSSGTHNTSVKFQEVAPDDHHIVESIPGEGQVYRTEPDFELPEGPVPYSRSVIGEKTMRPPSSQAQSSDSKLDPTQNHGDEPSTRSLPNQVAKQHAETQPPPTLVVPYDSESTQDVTSDTLGKAKSLKPSSIDQQATGSASTPDTHLGSASGEVARPAQKLPLKEPLSVVERNEKITVAEAESKVSRPVIAQQDVKHVPGISEPALDNVSTEEEYQRASEPREGPPPDVHGTLVDRKTAPSSSQVQSPDAKRDVLPLSVDVAKKTVPPSSQAQILPSSVDVGPSSDEQSTTRLRRDQEAQAQLPAATKKPPPFETPVYSKSNQDAPKSFKLPSGDQDVMSPKVVPASASDTQFGKVSDEITDDGQNSPLSAQDIARSAQRPSFVEPTEEDGIVAASDQTNEARPISGQRGITPTPDKQRITDLRGAVDEKMSLPSSQAQKSDIRPDSAPIDDDVHRTSGDEPATSSVRDSQARPPAGIQNVPAGFLEKTKSPRPLSTDQEPTASPAPAPDAPQDQDSNHSSQFSPSVVSRKDVANADQTNVSQAGLREPPSSDAKLPSEEIQESSPDAYLTKSEKPLPMKDPVRPPHDASFDLSSGEKPTMIKGDQASTISDGSPSASEEVGQPKNGAVKGPLAAELVSSFPQKNLEKTSPEEKWNHQQQTDQSTTRSSEDNNIEASGTRNPNTSTTSRDIQPSPLKERMQAVEGSRNQQQSGQAVFQSIQDNRTQIQETKARDTAFDKPEVISPDSAPTSGDAHRTSGDVPTTSSLRDSQAQPSAGTENVPAAYSEKESPRPLSTDQEVRTPLTMTNPTPAPDSPQDQYSNHASQFTPSVVSRKNAANADKTNISEAGLRGPASSDATPSEQIQESRPDDYLTKSEKELPMKGTDPVQPPEVAAFDLPSNGKPTMIKGDQVNTISSVSLSASKPVGQSESSVERPLSDELVSPFPEKHLEKRSPEEKSNQQQQTDQSSTRLTKDDSTESSGIASPNILTTSGDIQPSPLKQNNQAAERSRKQQQADPVFQSTQDNKRQTEETEAQDTGSDQHEEINPDSAPTSGDANRTSGDGPATSSLRNSQAQPPAETQNAPAVFSEKIKSPRLPSTDQELVTPLTSPAPTPDTPQDKDSIRSPQLPPPVESRRDIANTDQTDVSPAGLRETTSSDAMPPSEKIQESSPDAYLSKSEKPILPLTGTDTVQPPVEGSFDLSGDGKPTMIKGDQANTKSNVSLSPSQADSQSENSAVKGAPSDDSVSPFPQKNLERTSPEEKPKQQQQSSTRSSRDDSIEASETASPNILTTSGDIQPSPLNQPSPMKENIQAAEGFRNQQQADQDVFQPRQDNRKQIEEPEPQDTSTDYPEDTNGASQRAASEQQQGENVGRVQRQRNDTNNSYEPTKDAPSIIQADNKPESSSRTPEEPRQQAQPEGKTRGGEIMSPASETGQPEESDLPPSKKGRTNQSQSETSAKLEDQTPSATRNRGTNSSKLDGATDDTKSADTDDNNPSS
ncbi:microtubule-associated protein futsch-like isoform X7 [Triticum urartu]|uniref:microtubule-associated protein futsch-like isoform X7 n=1 Tax=Triticum urartu TaxID=4572 RepID=UPI0020447AC9|nr:microtubule-associated protein futsch-like isoform X7 [Triticum urartu]